MIFKIKSINKIYWFAKQEQKFYNLSFEVSKSYIINIWILPHEHILCSSWWYFILLYLFYCILFYLLCILLLTAFRNFMQF